MVSVSVTATDEELVQLVRTWLDVLAAEDYERVFDGLGYALAFGAGAQRIRRDLNQYRSEAYYPGTSEFRVSDWRTAVGGNRSPVVLVRRYEYSEDLPIIATIELDLLLNGKWSDLQAHFVVTKTHRHDSHGFLCLEDICYVQSKWADAT